MFDAAIYTYDIRQNIKSRVYGLSLKPFFALLKASDDRSWKDCKNNSDIFDGGFGYLPKIPHQLNELSVYSCFFTTLEHPQNISWHSMAKSVVTLPETNSKRTWKKPAETQPNRKGSYSTHPFLGALPGC